MDRAAPRHPLAGDADASTFGGERSRAEEGRPSRRTTEGRPGNKRDEELGLHAQAFATQRGVEILTVEEVARALRVTTKTVRRWIKAGRLVAHRIGPNSVRVDASSVTRLLTASPFAAAVVNDMPKKGDSSNEPRLLRQRGRSKVWTALINNQEVPLGTTNKAEAERNLRAMTTTAPSLPTPPATGGKKRQAWRVYPEGNGFVVKYYDAEGRRRTHRIANEAGALVTSRDEAERYAESWFLSNAGRSGPLKKPLASALARPDRITFEQFGRLWTSGELAKHYEDHVKAKVTAAADERRLQMYVYPVIGTCPMSAFEGSSGLELVERVLHALSPAGATFSRASRRQVIQAVHRLLVLAVYPAKLISANPLPKGFLPKPPPAKAKAYLYPSEDAKLLACGKVRLQRRLFYGLLAREGMRVSELLSLKWRDVDLDAGTVSLDQNKTDEPRTWPLDPGVAEALRRWKKHFAGSRAPSGHVLVDLSGESIGRFGTADGLRRHLKRAGVTRPQLFDDNEVRINLRAHDLRATFVTVNLAAGRTEAWITDRTGHKSSAMIYRYKRQARTHAELALGTLKPLYEAIPELARLASNS